MQRKNKPTIGYLTSDWAWGTDPLQPNGCAWYRCKLPADELAKLGWATALGLPGFNPKNGFGMLLDGGRALHGWDIIVFKLLMKREILEYMLQAMEMGQKIVVDVDDWFEGLQPTNRAYQATDPETNPDENRDIYAQIIQNATAVITSTPFLYNFYKAKRDNVYMVRNGIDIERWRRRQGKMNHRLRLGWVGATPWRSGDLETLSPWIGEYLLSRKMYFHHSGHTENGAAMACDQLGIHRNISRIQPLVPINLYPKLFNEIDIGIVPLNNIEFNHAKSFIKGLEYAAAGVPFVASYSPEYQYLADAGVGRVANNQEEWIYHIDELRDAQKRKDEIGHNYEILKDFTMAARASDWNEVMTTILEKK